MCAQYGTVKYIVDIYWRVYRQTDSVSQSAGRNI